MGGRNYVSKQFCLKNVFSNTKKNFCPTVDNSMQKFFFVLRFSLWENLRGEGS